MTPPRRRRSRRDLPLVLYTHPFELALGVALTINGVRGMLGGLSPSVADLPRLPLIMYLVISTVGGIGASVGVCWPNDPYGRPQPFGLSLERAALYLVGVAYWSLGLLIVVNNGANGVPVALVAGVVGGACFLRTIAIRRSTRVIIERLRQVHETRAGEDS